MEVLSSEIVYKMHPVCETIMFSGLGVFLFGLFIFFVFIVPCDYDEWLLVVSSTLILLGVITTFTFVIIGSYYWQIKDYTKQEVIFKEDIPNEFFNDYEILEQRGKIFVIKEKEN